MNMVEEKLGAYLEVLSVDKEYWYERIRCEANPWSYESGTPATDSPAFRLAFGLSSALTVLCLLPNLRELALHPDFSGSRYETNDRLLFPLRHLFRSNPDDGYRPNDRTYPLSYYPLGKLKTLLPCQSESGDELVSLASFRPFLELPCLKNFYYTSGVFDPSDNDFLERYHLEYRPEYIMTPDGISPGMGALQLRRLELYDSCLDPAGTRLLLHCCSQLEVLRYVHASKRDDQCSE
ncbi:hypothetical protein BU23DRAFT_317726 [Bimuria novae-zelandiae CBS 107.79]|uniref:Uncharacterized protein n=1 Tax=Bimuria novae-zelandiae CBS 107.79 TaxID=1447943 RepID=A0A6A5VQ20_9PLEO|nr:hypothetical protein BU23DRAFT_317726 [Bimuria novae-zelandiae CBS 107.79]